MPHEFSQDDVCIHCSCSKDAIHSFGWGCKDGSKLAVRDKVSPALNISESDQGLWADIKKYAGEAYSKGDAKSGMKLAAEIVGGASLLLLAGKISFVLTGGKSNYLLNRAFVQLARGYTKLNANDRKAVRAFVTLSKSGFGFFG